MNSKGDFNSSSAGSTWPDTALYALAGWWADQLPGAEAVTGRKPSAFAKPVEPNGFMVTAEQHGLFTEALVRRMRKEDPGLAAFPALTLASGESIFIGTLCDAGLDAGYGMRRAMPAATTYAYPDGQVFVPGEGGKSVPLDYPGRPDTPFKPLSGIDFSNCPFFRDERRYLVVPLDTGQVYTTVFYNEGLQYYEEVAKPGEVLVVREKKRGMLDQLTPADALNPKAAPAITCARAEPAQNYAEGKREAPYTITREVRCGGWSIFYAQSDAFRAWVSPEAFCTGAGPGYKAVNPGDYVAFHESIGEKMVVPRLRLEDGSLSWRYCDSGGQLLYPVETRAATKALHPLRLIQKSKT